MISVTVPLDIGCRVTLCTDDRLCDAAIEFHVAHTRIWSYLEHRYEFPRFQQAMTELIQEACRAHGCEYPP